MTVSSFRIHAAIILLGAIWTNATMGNQDTTVCRIILFFDRKSKAISQTSLSPDI